MNSNPKNRDLKQDTTAFDKTMLKERKYEVEPEKVIVEEPEKPLDEAIK